MRKLAAVPLSAQSFGGIGTFVDLASKPGGFTPDHMKIEMNEPYISICRVKNPDGQWVIDTMERHISHQGRPVPEILMSDRPFVIVAGRAEDWGKWEALRAILVPPWTLIELAPEAPHAGLFAAKGPAAELTNVMVILPRETWKNNCHLAHAGEAEKFEVVLA